MSVMANVMPYRSHTFKGKSPSFQMGDSMLNHQENGSDEYDYLIKLLALGECARGDVIMGVRAEL